MDVSLISSEDSSCKANAAQHMGLLASAFINEGGIDLVLSNMGILNDTIEEEAEGIDDILWIVEVLLDLDATGILSITHPQKTTPSSSSSVVTVLMSSNMVFLSWILERVSRKGPFHYKHNNRWNGDAHSGHCRLP